MSPSQQSTSINPAYLKNQFAHRFIRALNNLTKTAAAAHDHQMYRIRATRVKIAAYTAMASVVGSRRAWSRAVLSCRRIRNRPRNQLGLKKRIRNPNPKRQADNFNPSAAGQESKLRKLVPGAETMDSWCLMGETADYIKCLTAQVDVMKTLVDLYATT